MDLKTRKIKTQETEREIEIPRYLGRNSFGRHQTLAPGELRDCLNWDIFPGKERDELKSRRGSSYIRPASGATAWQGGTQGASAVWDTGTSEYLIVQAADVLYSQNLTTPANPVRIADFAGATFTLPTNSGLYDAEMFVHGDRLFFLHPLGNFVIEWFSGTSTFKARAMGMAYPWISGLSISSGGSIVGRYVYAVELVHQVAGVDILVSSPNRKFISTRTIADTGVVENDYVSVVISSTVLDASSLWTHVRLWRTKNLDSDNTDVLNPIDPQGLPEELYEVALVTRAEINAGALAAVATSATLPPGNAGVSAGKPAGAYTIRDSNTDSVLFNLIGLDRIELVPLPAATCGCFLGGRVWISTTSNDDILYSSSEGTKYSELYNPLNIIPTGRDGTLVKRLFAFERDLLVLKESKTGRLLGGDVDQQLDVLDHKIGISRRQNAEYLPGVGVCAITSDSTDFKVFTLGLTWTTVLNGMDIARPIHDDVVSMSLDFTRFAYINGKIMLSTGSGVFHVLHLQSGRGWTRYDYPLLEAGQINLFTFAGGSRLGTSVAASYTVELEKTGVDTDASQLFGGSATEPIALSHTTHMYQGEEGRNILECNWYSLAGFFNAAVTGTPYVNNVAWPAGTPVATAFTLSYSGYTSSQNRDGEYRLQLPTATVDGLLWQRFMGYFLHLKIDAVAPATIRHEKVRVTVDEDDSSFLARTALT